MNNTDNLQRLYANREMAANEYTEGYLHALTDMFTIFRETEELTDTELVDHIWQHICDRSDALKK